MADFNFRNWPGSVTLTNNQEDRKPFDRVMPFHRIRVPEKQIVPPGRVAEPKKISGDGYSMGARSTKDYDGKFGEDLAKELADVLKNIFPPLQAANLIAQGVAKGLAFLLGLIPGTEKAVEFLDNVDPLADLLGVAGNALDSLLVDSFIRSFPAWVPVSEDQPVLELDGILIRSHQRYDSTAFWQWNRWYDWRFAVCVSPVFIEMVGFGNTERDKDNNLGEIGATKANYLKEGVPRGSLSANAIAECEWDLGALGGKRANETFGDFDQPGPFFDEFTVNLQARTSARKPHDWCWPMTGMFFWAIGRSVYDCRHATKDNGRRTNTADRLRSGSAFTEEQRRERGVHLNALHPLKAIATARWEAFQFKENPKPVPAIQFMFYANNQLSSAGFFRAKPTPDSPDSLTHRSGFPSISDQNYEFIVDLPTAVLAKANDFVIGHTPEFALNTLVLRPRLLVDLDFTPYQNAGGLVEDSDDREKNDVVPATKESGALPRVALIRTKSGAPPQQAHVIVPLKDLSANQDNTSEINSYGVLVTMGWFDPEATQAKRVKKVTVRLLSFQAERDVHDDATEGEWNVNVGVNGRWFQFRFTVQNRNQIINVVDAVGVPKVPAQTAKPGIPAQPEKLAVPGKPVEVEMLLAEDDFVLVSVHGMEEDAYDDFFRRKPEFPLPEKRPPPQPPAVPTPQEILNDPKVIGKFKADLLARRKVLDDRLLRREADVTIKTGPPDPTTGQSPTTSIKVPMVGREIEWARDIDTDSDSEASLAARALFLRLAIGNSIDANDPLGMIDPFFPDPPRITGEPQRRSDDGTDTPNPLVVGDILKEVGPGVFKLCELTAYVTSAVGRMGALVYDPTTADYTFRYEVKVEELPAST